MNIIPLENKPLESFTQEQREKLVPFIGECANVETAKLMARIHAACGKDIGRATRLIQEGIPAGIVTYPDFVIQKDDFLDLFVVKSKSNQNKSILEAAIVAGIHEVCRSLDDTEKVINNLSAMGFKLVETSEYNRLRAKAEQTRADLETAKRTVDTFGNRIEALKDALKDTVHEEALLPGSDLFNNLLRHMKDFMLEDPEFMKAVKSMEKARP